MWSLNAAMMPNSRQMPKSQRKVMLTLSRRETPAAEISFADASLREQKKRFRTEVQRKDALRKTDWQAAVRDSRLADPQGYD
jgi:hypothetical protein